MSSGIRAPAIRSTGSERAARQASHVFGCAAIDPNDSFLTAAGEQPEEAFHARCTEVSSSLGLHRGEPAPRAVAGSADRHSVGYGSRLAQLPYAVVLSGRYSAAAGGPLLRTMT